MRIKRLAAAIATLGTGAFAYWCTTLAPVVTTSPRFGPRG